VNEKSRPRGAPVVAKLLTTEETAEILGVSVRTLEDWRSDGTGPDYVPLGRRTVRYRPQAIDRWLDTRERRITPGVA
jgi:excisionase family DNA binding protein